MRRRRRQLRAWTLFALLLLANGCTGSAQELGGNGNTPPADGQGTGSGSSTPSPATGDRKLAQIDADGSPRSELVGVAFIEAEGTRNKVGFVIVDRDGKPQSAVLDLGEGASPDAGISVTVDPSSNRFYVGWAEGATTARIHIHAIGYDASVKTFTPYPIEKPGAVQGLDVFASGNHLLISGFIGSSELFLGVVSAASAKPIQFWSGAERGATAPRTNIQGVRGDCEAGDGCMLTIRDAAGAHPKLGESGSPAIGIPIVILTTIDDTDPSRIGKVDYQLGATYESHEGGDGVRVTSDGRRLLSIGIESASGKTRLQGNGRGCGAVTLRGCENPTDMVWRDDFEPTTVGGNAGSVPLAIALDDSSTAFALTSGVAGDVLVFGSRRLPWPKSTPVNAPPSTKNLADKKSIHTLTADLSGDPILVNAAEGWTGVWIEGAKLFVRPF